ncbi:MAG: hypothetical protein H6718_10205 [Polyangiaceae bacterium]|nr:hypothetical protein [Polyangiaceae bacterium]
MFLVAGCPQLANDDFEVVDPASNGGVGGSDNDASAGSGGVGGNAGSAGVSGNAGTSGSGGTTTDGGSDAATCSECAAADCCDGQCVNRQSSPRHCGVCGNGCPGTTCSGGTCTSSCAQGFLDCDQNIVNGCEVNAAMDPMHCGNCDIACPVDATCVSGVCMCPTGALDCDGEPSNGCETSSDSDPQNCGGCGRACGPNQVCQGGSCTCADGYADCDSTMDNGCEADLTAPATCGSCANDCGIHATCAGTTCGCQTGYQDCDSTLGCELDLSDADHCGNCTTKCTGGTVCDGASCVSSCTSGTLCNQSCVDTDTSSSHCGGCNQPVGANQHCEAGQPTCDVGWADCNGQPGDGCEINTTNDAGHCGNCTTACKPGAQCTDSSCGCAPSTPKDCGSECRQCCGASDCSDGDPCTANVCNAQGQCDFSTGCTGGTMCCSGSGCFECCDNSQCGSGQTCSGGQCVSGCTSPQTLCGGSCVNTQTDANHCGGCGVSCGNGRSCSGGQCSPRWVTMAAAPGGFAPRTNPAYAVINGTQVFIWGGSSGQTALATGAIYDVATNTWTSVAQDANTPSAREGAVAVWTGSKVVVWGGLDRTAGALRGNGALYDPSTNSWSAMASPGNALGARTDAYGVWTGTRALIWGGTDTSGKAEAGVARYEPGSDTWLNVTSSAAPNERLDWTWAWDGAALLLAGGDSKELFRYQPDTWQQLDDASRNRRGAFGGWTGAEFIFWGGRDKGSILNSGERYSEANHWGDMSTTNAPSARWAPHRETGWSARIRNGELIFLGGRSSVGASFLTNGATYNAFTNAWTSVPSWPSGHAHSFGVGAFAGGEFVLWGGGSQAGGNSPVATGERYLP